MTTVKAGELILSGQCISTHGSILILENHKIAFDCGIIPANLAGKLASCKAICITHGHADHISALHMDHHNRVVKTTKDVVYIMPECCIKPWITIVKAFQLLNSGCHYYNSLPDIISVQDKSIIPFTKQLTIHAHQTIHRVHSLGYTLVETKEKLRDIFQGIDYKILTVLKKHGVELTYKVSKPIFSYTGDSTIEGVLKQPDFLNSEVLVTECTFLDDSMSIKESKERGHIHLDELVDNQDKFKGVLVLCHFSQRYTNEQIKNLILSKKWKKEPVILC